MKTFLTAAAAAAGFGSTVYAQTVQSCPETNVCYSLNVPASTGSSGTGDIYFQITAPTTYTWVAFGQGSQMSGANIFVLYQDASGTNVTLSPRLGTGHVEPKYNSAADVALLAGSGISNGIMTANVRCSSCDSWSGGSMDFSSSSGKFIWAVKSGSALDSDSTSASISQHDSSSAFNLDLSKAKGGSSTNPFLTSDATTSSSGSSGSPGSSGTTKAASTCSAASSSGASGASTTASSTMTSTLASPTGSGCPTSWPTSWSTAWPSSRPTQYASCFQSWASSGNWPTAAPYVKFMKRASDDTCSDDSTTSNSQNPYSSGSGSSSGSSGNSGASGFSSNEIPFGGDFVKANKIFLAHGVMAGLAFIILFPFGAISIRLLSFPGLIWVHAAIQALAYLLYIVAFGLGIYMATQLHELNETHPIIGIVLLVLLFFQPILGILHHRYFKRHNRRTFWSHAHIWLGRIAITLGIVNGGLGLQLANNTRKGEIAYAVVAAVVWVVYVASIVVGEVRRRRSQPPAYDKSVQMERMSGGSEGGSPPAHREWYGKRT